ncbi:hypothetical protein THTE_2139 [Thermogutta terrifontis]|uniref:Uncharacterized protein n=1 Tax=Thermogutta terrifontis TaxID=1331910 RepID=A0A286RFK6_9BACT|nr:hypothetical protein THTE_2139 [Thermogutta terrifontis]
MNPEFSCRKTTPRVVSQFYGWREGRTPGAILRWRVGFAGGGPAFAGALHGSLWWRESGIVASKR